MIDTNNAGIYIYSQYVLATQRRTWVNNRDTYQLLWTWKARITPDNKYLQVYKMPVCQWKACLKQAKYYEHMTNKVVDGTGCDRCDNPVFIGWTRVLPDTVRSHNLCEILMYAKNARSTQSH
jgi:hypothetical protein